MKRFLRAIKRQAAWLSEDMEVSRFLFFYLALLAGIFLGASVVLSYQLRASYEREQEAQRYRVICPICKDGPEPQFL